MQPFTAMATRAMMVISWSISFSFSKFSSFWVSFFLRCFFSFFSPWASATPGSAENPEAFNVEGGGSIAGSAAVAAAAVAS